MSPLEQELKKLTGAYCEEAPEGAVYPYIVFSAKRLSESEGKQQYTLEINVWDQDEYYSRAESMMDSLEEKLHKCSHMTDALFIRIFKGPRKNVADPDKTIKRVMEQFGMHVFEREE